MEDKIYIEVISDSERLVGENTLTPGTGGRKTFTTGIVSSAARQMIELDFDLVKKIKDRIGTFCDVFSDSMAADETELEFSFGITGSGNVCILSGSSQLGIKVVLKWKK